MHPKTHEFRDLFLGLEIAFGRYIIDSTEQNGKRTGNERGLKHGKITMEMWSDHLTGVARLGIVPINEESKSRWGAIDYDPPMYPAPKADILELIRKVHKHNLPLIPCRSKSGGLHLYYHIDDWVDSRVLRLKLDGFAAVLGLGNCEVFPRQVKLNIQNQERGNYINLPYFSESKECSTYAYNASAEPLSFVDYWVVVRELRRPFQESISVNTTANEALPDGAPCISRILFSGVPEGMRNTVLTQLCVYAKLKYPNTWKEEVKKLAKNFQYFPNPEPDSAIESTLKSYDGKDYSYQCNNPPMCNFCDRGLCRTRPFGIGSSGEGLPISGTMIRYNGQNPYWEICVLGSDNRVKLDEDALISFREYRKCVLRDANVPIEFTMKDLEWAAVVSRFVREALVSETPPEETLDGFLRSMLEEFLTSKVQAKEWNEILLGKPYLVMGLHLFRLRDFFSFLERTRFGKEVTREHLGRLLRQNLKLETTRKTLRGEKVLLYGYPEIKRDDTPLNVPDDTNPSSGLI